MQSNITRSPKSQYFPATMLPPPPLPPMARPVAIIRSTGDVTNSPPTSITPPGGETSPQDEVLGPSELSSSPPLSPNGVHERRKSPLQRISTAGGSYSPNRDYSFNHFHTQPGHVGSTCDEASAAMYLAGASVSALQLSKYDIDEYNVWCDQSHESQHVLVCGEHPTYHTAL